MSDLPESFTSLSPDSPSVHAFFEHATSTWQYIVADPSTSHAVIIDPVLDYDPASGNISTTTAETLLTFIQGNGLKVQRILESHAHADHLSSSQYLKRRLEVPGSLIPICIGARIEQVQHTFATVYGLDPSVFLESFDIFLEDEEEFRLGELACRVMHLPGHTPDHVGYLIGDSVFCGDSIFLPDVGSARVDFPGGNAHALYMSMNRLLSLPDRHRIFVGHDYPPKGRAPRPCATVEEQRRENKHCKIGISEDEFVAFRQARDAILGSPRLLHQSIQVNVRAGKLPAPDPQGRAFLKIPLRNGSAIPSTSV
ncbi:Metallo-hydrolase/oxidoreductase [Punctularia strigosozonata HHB-11173 SS5]|uniref:Metallo-hydrolase/oxidoreductase n=1 Tax=Punctularia strigosozonata (strain HHB-11173) TaxID=741275 RepID=UPI0004418236|nr:Metallo-hydrolase/oxidoreductase [Punctularia strigosozonata HHB-11173 SS5]EIN11986.1 Metallo-hydrolase/oxidoreductase [Punctularia strigosozonata HHB-11173 SS5]